MLISCNEKDSVYDEVCALAEEMNIFQDELLVIAIEKYIQRRKNQKLLHSINNAYADGLDASEEVMLDQMRRHQQQLFEQEYLQ
ncbi:hypothetical protein CAL7716_086130 [Calothrix sp. PCC 7716]|nr:hypothetical protein CAL7716_086130 [Calothrix sp. PCC 7716]